jgi:hypothetical protein
MAEYATPEEIEQNKKLLERYPFLNPYPYFDDDFNCDNRKFDKNNHGYHYEFTMLDGMPDGWRKAFAEPFLEELREELIKNDFLYKYTICQVKEKYGGLRWYDNGTPIGSKVPDIISKYENLSEVTCIKCGKPAKWLSTGWISPFCDDCAQDLQVKIPIEDYSL